MRRDKHNEAFRVGAAVMLLALLQFHRPMVCKSQELTVDDLRAGYQTSLATLLQGGVRVQWIVRYGWPRAKTREYFVEAVRRRLAVEVDAKRKQELEQQLRQFADMGGGTQHAAAYDAFLSEAGFQVRRAYFQTADEFKALWAWVPTFPDSFGPYERSDDSVPYHTFTQAYGEDRVITTTMSSGRKPVLGYITSRESISDWDNRVKSPVLTHQPYSAPFYLPFDRQGDVYLPVESLLYGENDGLSRTVKQIDNHLVALTITQPPSVPNGSGQTELARGAVFEAVVDTAQGFLPVSLRGYEILEYQGKPVARSENHLWEFGFSFRLSSLADRGAFVERIEYYVKMLLPAIEESNTLDLNSTAFYIWRHQQPHDDSAVVSDYLVGNIEVVKFQPWELIKTETPFWFQPPPGARVFDKTTGEMLFDPRGQKSLRLELGDRSHIPTHAVTSQQVGVMSKDIVLFRIAFWSLVVLLSIAVLAWARRRYGGNLNGSPP